MFITKLWENPAYFILWVAVVTFSICVHEVAHALAAAGQGDRTACDAGYCTLNPMKVMGPQSLIMLAVCGVAWGGVPVNPAAFRRSYSHVLVACAGPAANLLLAVFFAVVSAVLGLYVNNDVGRSFTQLSLLGINANCMLLILNMLPVPLLDGWQFWSWALPPLRRLDAEKRAGLALFLLVVLFMTPLGHFVWDWTHVLGRGLLGGAVGVLGVIHR